MTDVLAQPWPWYIAGPLIAMIMMLLLFFGESFGFSNNLRTICAIGGAGKMADFFAFDWKKQIWNLTFLMGAVIGGFIAHQYLSPDQSIEVALQTSQELEKIGFTDIGSDYLPAEIFGPEAMSSFGGILILLIGGFLVGFGARYAGGCTSGHAISGLSDLQIPSLIAVIGFFIGGLIMVHFIMPLIF